MRMRHRLPALLVSAMLLVLIVAPVQARTPEQSRHEQIVAHWTAARMAAAVPRDFVHDGARGFAPAAKPPGTPGGPGGGGGGGGDGTGFTTGASWNAGGAIKERTGKVYFEMAGGAYVCSGSVATDSRTSYSLVLTAAHCAYDETDEAFATHWLFIPDFDQAPTFTCANTEYGCWTASSLVVHSGYAEAGGFNTQATLHDFAFAVVGGGGHSGSAQLDATVGSFSLSIPGFTGSGQTSYAFGYPAAQKYKGNDLVYCAGSIFEDPYNDELTWGLPCRMTGGSSGGPWLSSFDTSTGIGSLSSLNSYGYAGVSAMHGPKFNSDTSAVYSAANSATTANVVVP
jgi:V8-like Glu-specific endopeptidase